MTDNAGDGTGFPGGSLLTNGLVAASAAAALYVLAKRVPWFSVAYRLYRFPAIGHRFHARLLRGQNKANAPPPPPPSIVHRCRRARVTAIPFLSTNYAYLVRCEVTGAQALIDPGDPDRCLHVAGAHASIEKSGENSAAAAAANNETARPPPIEAVLATHWHADHSYGNLPIRAAHPAVRVHAPAADDVPGVTHPVKIGDAVTIGQLEFQVLRGSGHTKGGVIFLLSTADPQVAFTGDAVFSGGIGALFEGDAAEMARTLDGFSALPAATEVLPGHEYAVASLGFASALLGPGDAAVSSRLAWARNRQYGFDPPRPAVPSTVGEELRHNVFLRTAEPKVAELALAEHARRGLRFTSPQAASWPERTRVLAALRELKDDGFGEQQQGQQGQQGQPDKKA